MSDLQWAVRDIGLDEEIPEPEQWPEDEFGPADEEETNEEEGEPDGAQE